MSVSANSVTEMIAHSRLSGLPQPLMPCDPEEILAARSGLSRRALRRALDFIDAHLCERFTLEELAKAAGVSRYHFARQFRISTGRSPMMYQRHVRLERGKQMLARGDRSICDIAATLGFCDQSHFTRSFRRMMGLAPRDYAHRCDDAR